MLVQWLPPQPGEFINPAVPLDILFILSSRTCSKAIFPKITFSIPFSPFHLVTINQPSTLPDLARLTDTWLLYTTPGPRVLEECHICNTSTSEGVFEWWHFLPSESPADLEVPRPSLCFSWSVPAYPGPWWLWAHCEISRTNTVAGQPTVSEPSNSPGHGESF